uniref:Uncharacterized protein n=1 Tax=Eptatretus burgeri TaxID=7764 RepID=A0A8C4N7P2_EPTBU
MPLDMVVASSNVTYIRWKVHDDWVSEIKYYPCVQRVISSSNHAGTALVIGCTIGSTHHIGDFKEMSSEGSKGSGFRQLPARRQMRDETVFPVHKGVKTFDFCKDLDLLVTGGLDGPVRMWNPLVPGCTAGVLKGHRAPICYVAICQDRAQIFSVDSKSCVKVWNVVAQTCIGSVSGRCNGLVGSITACAYLPTMQWLCMCADSPVLLVIQNR